MSTTSIFFIICYTVALFGSFVNPLFGALGYLFEYYMNPALHWWGKELPSLRWNLLIASTMTLSYVLRSSSLPKLRPVRNLALPFLLSLNVLMFLVTATAAVNHVTSFNWTIHWMKLAIVFPLIVVAVVRTRGAWDALITMHMWGGFWWGWNAWTHPKRSAGRLEEVGSGDTYRDNGAAAHLITILPFALVFMLTHKNKKLRAMALLAFPFVINTIILCNSRGAMLGVVAGLGTALLLVRKGQRARMAGLAVVTAVAFFALADPVFFKRQQTTANFENNRSATERLESWQAGLRLVRDHPFGAGGRGFHLLSPKYIPGIVASHDGDNRAPHNTYVMVASEWGIPGLILFFCFLGATYRMLLRVRKAALARGDTFYYYRAVATMAALSSALIAAVFTDRYYAEIIYWLCGFGAALYRIQQSEFAEAEEQERAAEPIVVSGSSVARPELAAYTAEARP